MSDYLVEKSQADIIKEGEERFRLALDSVGDGAWDWNIRTGYVYYSDKWIASLGYSRQDVAPDVSFWESLISPEDKEMTSSVQADLLSGETEEFHFEYRLRTKSGDYRWTLSRGRVLERDVDGRALRMVGTNCDITEEKLARAAQERAENQCRSIIDTAGSIILCLDANNLILEFNPAAENLFGWKRSEVLTKNFVEWFLPEETRLQAARDIENMLVSDDVVHLEGRVPTRAGDEKTLLWSVARLVGENDEVSGLVAVAQDVSERKQAERDRELALREREIALDQVKALSGLLPICSACKRIRNEDGQWVNLADHLEDYSEARISHGICPECRPELSRRPLSEEGRGTTTWERMARSALGDDLSPEGIVSTIERVHSDPVLRAHISALNEEILGAFFTVYNEVLRERAGSQGSF